MIFYFTGTGNSLYAAEKLAAEGESVISMIDASRRGEYHYTLTDGEALGFVFPVYFYTVSDPVLDFVRQLTVENCTYVYAVIPCGASIGHAGALLKDELEKRGLHLVRVDKLVTPDGALIFYDIDEPDALSAQLERAAAELEAIGAAIRERKTGPISGSAALGRALLKTYHACTGTKKFYVEDSCIHCGKCADLCPAQAITLLDGVPVWTKKKCYKCCGCINRCPVAAIQHGNKTASRCRYVNPVLR